MATISGHLGFLLRGSHSPLNESLGRKEKNYYD